jgi:hypothetical protein
MAACMVLWAMRPPIFVRPLTDSEYAALEEGLRSPVAFTFRRCQILLASAQARIPTEIAASFGCCEQTVRNVVHSFNAQGFAALERQSCRPKTVQPLFDEPRTLALRDLLHRSPRDFGPPTSVWTLKLAAQVCCAEGLTDYQVSYETIRQALLRLKVRWQRAKHWITSPDPDYAKKKRRRDRLIELAAQHDWVVGYLDEVWWSRFALPNLRLWQDKEQPLRLVEQTRAAGDAAPKALACYGLWCDRAQQMFLRFVTGRPVSHVTTAFLTWVCAQLAKQGEKVVVLIWDNASWHVSAAVRDWIAGQNAAAKRSEEGLRILLVGLPTKSPWLNIIEPKWQHGKQAIVEPERALRVEEVEERVCAYFGTSVLPHLVQVKKEPAGEAVPQPRQLAVSPPERPAQAAKTQKVA